ncbi:putative MATE efflux family protein subfamily [Meredithblackwellia eburnea MCA 4105]
MPSETTPLLLESTGTKDVEQAIELSFSSELWLLCKSSLPVALSYSLQNSLQTLSVAVVGRMGPAELSAAAFSYMLAMCTGWCVALGGTTAVDTLASVVYTSSTANKTEVGILLQRCFVSLSILFLPFAVLWWFIHPVLLLLGQTEELAVNCQAFLRVLSLGAPGYIFFESVKKYLQVQGIMHASTLVLLFTSPFNVVLNYVLVYHTSLGFLGAPLATSITYWLSFGLLCAYCKFVQGSACWGGWDRQCLHRIGSFMSLAIPGVLHVGTEWWAFEIVALAAGHLGDLPLSAQSVIMTVDQIMNTLPFGIGVAASARIGNLLGAKAAKGARVSSHAAVALSTIIGTLVLTALMISRNKFGYLFSDEDDTVALVAHVLPYVAAFQIADGWAQSCGGVLRGMGKQNVGAAVNLVAYYLLALPLGIALAFKTSLGLAGLWIGQCVALFLVGIGEYILVILTKWEVEVDRSQARLDSGECSHH